MDEPFGMTARGHCSDNAVEESFSHTLQIEETQNKLYEREEGKYAIFEYMEVFYLASVVDLCTHGPH